MIMSEKLYKNKDNLPNKTFGNAATQQQYDKYLIDNYGINSIPLQQFIEEVSNSANKNVAFENAVLDDNVG